MAGENDEGELEWFEPTRKTAGEKLAEALMRMKCLDKQIDYAIKGTEKLTLDYSEKVLAIIIDKIYLRMKDDFCDYENKTHKLGWFKELVKDEFHKALTEEK
jgi:hypothetical protein